MATNTVGIDKEVEVNRKENLRDHRLYWIGRRCLLYTSPSPRDTR